MTVRNRAGAPGGTPESTPSRRRRIASSVVGGTLLVAGIKRRSLAGAATALAGGWLFYRGLGGGGSLARRVGVDAGSEADQDRREAETASGESGTEQTVTIRKPAEELYERWREPETLSRAFGGFAEVIAAGDDRQRWAVSGPLGATAAWETEIVEDRPGELLRWESTGDATVSSELSVHLRPAPADRGTEVTLRVRVDPPGGAVGDAVAKRLGIVPDLLARKALRRFKSLAETGEIPTLEGNPSARGKGDLL